MALAAVDRSDHKHQFEPMPHIDEDMKYEVPPLDIDVNAKMDANRPRRFSVSAEASDQKSQEKFHKKVYPKSKEALERIKQSTADVFLFQGLDAEQRKLLIDAMFEKKCKAEDEIISQGDKGDYFYVVESGQYEVWKSANTRNPAMGCKKVFQYNGKGAFGELALMYNAPRAATVKALSDGVLWAVDRSTFRHIIVGCTARKRKRYDNFLKDVRLLRHCSDQLRASIADILETVTVMKGQYVFRRGDKGDHFYFVVRGEAVVTIGAGKEEKAVRTLKSGQFFGERAIMMNDTRSANVRVVSDKMDIAGMSSASFIRLFGSFQSVFRERFKHYYFEDIHAQKDDGGLSDIE